ncbi:putative NUDIX family NTP pyrophosphohydrolase [Tamaricihabitans halophyticus]|uniref:Putative NUDIX family NTP pyrophosphohydrolase n=1 Tax=Tamaricihabitans halophyticus TaxID=1262583 RepID=A0A4R2QSM2_9PSEU|nr:NUDIX domain-containing protein [Tamaricihabitans halophyticus]TCP50051.1 putative NUDIX family NTP pyrophosphohydrolase [Tamaricihabitans halophyticus]
MVARRSAGVLVFRERSGETQVLLGHMGGPFWAHQDDGAWSIPKGEYEDDESAWDAARREFTEELGLPVPVGEFLELGTIRQPGGKLVTIWAVRGDLDPATVEPGTFELEWPPRSGRFEEFPELDRVEWFSLDAARPKLVRGQPEFLARLAERLAA